MIPQRLVCKIRQIINKNWGIVQKEVHEKYPKGRGGGLIEVSHENHN